MAEERVWLTPKQIDRFWSKVDKTPGHGPNGECWLWTAGMKTDGEYGGFWVNQVNNTMCCHKVAFLIEHRFAIKDIPDDIIIRHSCNNPSCCNPEYLLLGTHKDNSKDMVMAGNSQRGEKNYKCVLTQEQVKEMRSLWATGQYRKSDLGRKYGINQCTVGQILANRTWRDESYICPRFDNTKNQACKFTNQQIEDVRQLKAAGISAKEISSRIGMSISQVYNILRGDQRNGK